MRIFVAGATGAIGSPPRPAARSPRGHDVIGTTRSPAQADALRAAGADAVDLDALDRDAVLAAVAAARPDVVVHQLTALGGLHVPRNFDRAFAVTNRLRTEGTDNLLAAARGGGRPPVVAQSYAGWPVRAQRRPGQDRGRPARPRAAAADARRRSPRSATSRRRVTGAGGRGLVLRYGGFYGPGTGIAPDGEQLELVRKRALPGRRRRRRRVVVHPHRRRRRGDRRGARGRRARAIYNVVDDEPAPVARVAAGARRRGRREAAAARPALARPRWPAGRQCRDDDRRPRRVERQGASASSAGRPRTRPGARASSRCSRRAGARRPSPASSLVLAGGRLLQPQLRAAAVELEEADLVVEVRRVVREAPADRRRPDAGGARQRAGRRASRPANAARIMRRSRSSSGLRNGEQVAW